MAPGSQLRRNCSSGGIEHDVTRNCLGHVAAWPELGPGIHFADWRNAVLKASVDYRHGSQPAYDVELLALLRGGCRGRRVRRRPSAHQLHVLERRRSGWSALLPRPETVLRCTAIWSAVSGAAFGERPVESVTSKGASWREAFPDSDPLAVKLASDSVRFLARATNLDPAP